MMARTSRDLPVVKIKHPCSQSIMIVGLHASNNGRSCESHACCGAEAVDLDAVVRFRSVQVWRQGREETAVAAYWVTDGIDRCRIGFLKRELVKDAHMFEGRIAQVVEFLTDSDDPEERAYSEQNAGACRAVFIESIWYHSNETD